MISVSANFATAITGTTREIRAYLDFNSGTIFRGADGLISIRFENSLMDEDRVSVGCACSSYVVCEWFNKLTGVSLANSYFDAYIGVVESYAQTKPVGSIEDDTAVVEYVKLGRFWVTDIERGKATTKVTAYDAMSKAIGDYSPTVTAGVNGYSVPSIISDICTQNGITWTSSGSAYVDKIYESTGREQLGWLCSVLYGDGSSFVIDRTSGDLTAVNFVKSVADGTIDDTTIYLDGVEDKPTFTIGSVEMGTDENTYTAGSGVGISRFNPYATQTIVDSIYADVDGMSFTPMKLHFRGDPRIEVGDLLSVTTDSNTYSVTVMKQTLTFNGGLECTLECFGDLEAHYIMSKSPTEAQFQRTNTVIAEMAEALENADNGIITTIKDADGYPTELLILNSMDKDTATSVWRWNINGLGHTNAYNGGTYNFALDDQGRINASMLIIGTITDQQGYNSWNLDTGAFTITNGSLNITTNSASNDKIQLTYNDTLNSIQWTTRISPSGVISERLSTNGGSSSRFVMQGANIYGYSNTNVPDGTVTYGTYIGGQGAISLGQNSHNGSMTIYSGDYVLNTAGRWMTLQSISNNTSISMYQYHTSPNAPLLRIIDREVRINDANSGGNLIASLGESSGTGQLVLSDGTNVARAKLTNDGLTFRDTSAVATFTYPSYGLYAQDMGSRNLLPQMFSATIVSGDITFTPQTNGSVYVSGTATATATTNQYTLYLEAGDYIISTGSTVGNANSGIQINGTTVYKGSGTTFTQASSGTVTVRLRVQSGDTHGEYWYPMIRPASITDTTYYPYAMTNRELTEIATATTQSSTGSWTTTTVWSTTGVSLTLTPGWWMIEAVHTYNGTAPTGVAIVEETTNHKYIYAKTESDNFSQGRASVASAVLNITSSSLTLTVWARGLAASSTNPITMKARRVGV